MHRLEKAAWPFFLKHCLTTQWAHFHHAQTSTAYSLWPPRYPCQSYVALTQLSASVSFMVPSCSLPITQRRPCTVQPLSLPLFPDHWVSARLAFAVSPACQASLCLKGPTCIASLPERLFLQFLIHMQPSQWGLSNYPSYSCDPVQPSWSSFPVLSSAVSFSSIPWLIYSSHNLCWNQGLKRNQIYLSSIQLLKSGQ